MELIHKHVSFWGNECYPYAKLIEISVDELELLLNVLDRLDIIEWLMWNDPSGIYADEQSKKEFGMVMSKDEGIEILRRQVEENRVIRKLTMI